MAILPTVPTIMVCQQLCQLMAGCGCIDPVEVMALLTHQFYQAVDVVTLQNPPIYILVVLVAHINESCEKLCAVSSTPVHW